MNAGTLIRTLGPMVALALGALSASIAQAEIKISVEDTRGVVATKAQWQPLADYLTTELGQPVTMVPLTSEKAVNTAAAKQVDFMLGNPTITAIVGSTLDGQLVASLVQPWGDRFAGLIITTPATGIRSIADLRGKKLITLITASAAGHMFQRDYLLAKGFDVATDFSSMKEVPRQDDVVLAVKSGIFDVGFCRTGILEDMARKGKIEMSDFVVIGKVDDPEYPFVHTTELYPEWYMVALQGIDAELTAKLKSALMALKPNSKVSEALGIKGFQEPLPIKQVTDLLTRLKIAPFNQ